MRYWLSKKGEVVKVFLFVFLSIMARSLKRDETQKNNQFLGHDEKFVFLAFFAWELDETEPYTRNRDAQLY